MKQTYQGACHCGRIRFEVLAEIDHVRVCDCSVCRMRGALIHRIPKDDLKLLTPLNDLTLYQWGSRSAKDYFCPVCGILPFRKPSDPTREELDQGIAPFDGWAVNTRCLADFDLENAPRKNIPGSRIKLTCD
ncbi:MAG: GFA family protein [Roseibium sp.]|uniref:GFA family protein n=1 Tax=Roseibium sp. TaxID=1936156 RepID=UPI002612EA1E|nr:GFA family protein [Roseibium sp.]MCV0426331.1 GFA family protein [Roseibium sp.]